MGNDGFLLACVFAGILALLGWLFQPELAAFSIQVSKGFFYVLSDTFFSHVVTDSVLSKVQYLRSDFYRPYDENIHSYSYIASLWSINALLLCPIPLILVFFSWADFRLPETYKKYRRILTRNSLLRIHAKRNPSLWAVIDQDILLKNPYSGAWRFFDSPIHFALKHRLLVDVDGKPVKKPDPAFLKLKPEEKRKYLPPEDYTFFDEDACDSLYKKLLGRPSRKQLQLRQDVPRYVAFASLLPFMAGGKANRRIGEEFCHKLSSSFKGKPEYSQDREVAWKLLAKHLDEADELLLKYGKIKPLREAFSFHHYELTLFISMFFRAKEQGKTVTTDWLWLRAVDYPLFITLDSVSAPTLWNKDIGCRTPWVEAAAAAAHYHAENVSKSLQTAPIIEAATDALLFELLAEKWVRCGYEKSTGELAANPQT